MSLRSDIKNIYILCKFLLRKRKASDLSSIHTIHSLSYRDFAPEGGVGGGGAVLTCQKLLLKNHYKQYDLKYSFREWNRYENLRSQLWILFVATYYAFNKTKKEEGTVYITHDYATAFGLYLAGKRYVYINHLQGPRVEEKTNYGEKFSYVTKRVIQFAERLVIKNAFMTCFPSQGAADYFKASKEKTVKNEELVLGPILYNTLYAHPMPEIVENILPDDEILTFLSVGQLTVAKGIDQHPAFFDEFLKQTDRKVRFIVVGIGVLQDQIKEKCATLKLKYPHFDYIFVGQCSYPQVQYLQGITDVYLMLHRISIFDLATLELMSKSKTVVLSAVGGNTEFNREDNIILFDGDFSKLADQVAASDYKLLGKKNLHVYNTYFSNEKFVKNYHYLMDLLTVIK